MHKLVNSLVLLSMLGLISTACSPGSGLPATSAQPPVSAIHPLSIEHLRRQNYPGREILLEETLEPGSNYNRYIASYHSENLKIFALMTIPIGNRPPTGWPVIVFNHGYVTPTKYRTVAHYPDSVDGFARSGFIVFQSDYRGHGFSEGEAHGAYSNPDYTIDVLNAVAALKHYPDVDPQRIGMWGHSMGGYITLRAMVTTDDIRAAVIWGGMVASPSDLITGWIDPGLGAQEETAPYDHRWVDQLQDAYGSPGKNPDFWNRISANAYLHDLAGPVQLHHGTADTSVPLYFSEKLAEQILDAGGTVEYYEYEDDNHFLSYSFSLAMIRSIAFFDTYVKGNP